MEFETLVKMLAILVALVVIIMVILIPVLKSASHLGETSTCSLKLFLSSALKKGTLGLTSIDTPPECATKIIRINEGLLKSHLEEAEIAIDNYYKDPVKYAEALQFFDRDCSSSKWEWALNKIFADALFDCWALKAGFGVIDTSSLIGSDTTCLVCADITFNQKDLENIKKLIKTPCHRPFIADKDYIGSLGAFMRAEFKGSYDGSLYNARTYDEWINNNYQAYPLSLIPYNLDSQYSVVYVMTGDILEIPLIGRAQKSWLELRPHYLNLFSKGSVFGREFERCEKVLG
jgi:hypothetical protein